MGCGSSAPVSKEALNVDKDNDGLISKEEMASFISENDKLWAMLAVNLSLPENKCRDVATEVAFQMAKKRPRESLKDLSAATRNRKPTVAEFQVFLDNYVNKPQGQQEFFQRTVFRVYDADESGYIEPHELDKFVDVFYAAGSIFAGDARLPDKETLKERMLKQLDTNEDGKLEFSEIRKALSGGARASLQFDD